MGGATPHIEIGPNLLSADWHDRCGKVASLSGNGCHIIGSTGRGTPPFDAVIITIITGQSQKDGAVDSGSNFLLAKEMIQA